MSRLHLSLAAALLGACTSTVEPPAAASRAASEGPAPAPYGAAEVAPRPPASASPMTAQDKADLKAIMAASQPGIPFTLDMSNPLHYRFFIGHMNRAGVTADRYPQLFKVTEAARLKPAAAVERRSIAELTRAVGAGEDPPVTPVQTLTSLGTADGTTYAVSALSSLASASYSSLTVSLNDAEGNLVGTPTQVTSATQPASNLNALASGAPANPGAGVNASAVYFWEDQSGTPNYATIQAVVGASPTRIDPLDPMPHPPSVLPPVWPPVGWPFTRLCLGRSGDDCSYTPVGGTASNVLMPVQGSVTFASPIMTTSPKTAIVTMARPDPTEGGGCTVLNTTDFFSDPNTRFTNGNKTLTWNFANMQFEAVSPCLQVNSTAVFTLALSLWVNNQQTWVAITSSTKIDPTNPNYYKIPEFQVYWSCVADGTLVTLKGGRQVPIEDVKIGQEVIIDQTGRTGVIESKLKGREEAPIVILRTAGNRALRATEGHPIITDRGPILASMLKPGDKVMTTAGLRPLVSVSRENFSGHVWNLSIGAPPDSLTDPRVTGSTFVADGFVIGDNLMQFVENRRERISQGARTMRAAPPEWHRDIQSAIEDSRP